MEIFKQEITVPSSSIDALDHVNNVTYLQWVQDIAEQHWNARTNEELREKYYWVVVDHFIEYKAPAYQDDVLILQTWVENYSTATCERHTLILNNKDHRNVVTAKTTWCLINRETGKPTRITEEIRNLFL